MAMISFNSPLRTRISSEDSRENQEFRIQTFNIESILFSLSKKDQAKMRWYCTFLHGFDLSKARAYEILSIFLKAVYENRIDIVDRLSPFLGPADFSRALIITANKGHIVVAHLLVDKGADVNAKDLQKDQTALMYAVKNRDRNMAKFFLDFGANLFALSASGKIALRIAFENRDLSMARWLILNDPNEDVLETETETTNPNENLSRIIQ